MLFTFVTQSFCLVYGTFPQKAHWLLDRWITKQLPLSEAQLFKLVLIISSAHHTSVIISGILFLLFKSSPITCPSIWQYFDVIFPCFLSLLEELFVLRGKKYLVGYFKSAWTNILLLLNVGINKVRTAIEFVLVVEWGWDRKLLTNKVLFKCLMITLMKIIPVLQTLISRQGNSFVKLWFISLFWSDHTMTVILS